MPAAVVIRPRCTKHISPALRRHTLVLTGVSHKNKYCKFWVSADLVHVHRTAVKRFWLKFGAFVWRKNIAPMNINSVF